MSNGMNRREFLRGTAALSLLTVAGCSEPSSSHTAAGIAVGRSGTPRSLTPTFFGLNGNNLQDRLSWDRADFGAALTSLRPGVLRYPGGTIGNYWAWRAGWFQANGPWPGQTNNRTGQVIASFDDSLTPFSVALKRCGAQSLLVVNMLTVDGRLATDADNQRMIDNHVQFLQAAAAAGVSVNRVELGNEFYLSGPTPGANGSDYSTRFPTAAAYARQANPWVSAFRTAFPAVQIAAVGADATGSNTARREGWNAGVMGEISGVDALTIHPYIVVKDSTATLQSLLSLPYQRVQSLAATEFAQLASHGLGAWITEFNLVDRTPSLIFAGTWAHGLGNAAYALMLAASATVKQVDLHNVVGDAVAGSLFDTTTGFRTATPATQFLGRSAMGTTYATLLQATKASTTAQALSFPAGPILPGGAPGLVGMDFTGGTQHQAVVVSLTPGAVTLDLAGIFPGTFNWSRQTTASLSTRITGSNTVTVTNGTVAGPLTVPGHCIVRIFQ